MVGLIHSVCLFIYLFVCVCVQGGEGSFPPVYRIFKGKRAVARLVSLAALINLCTGSCSIPQLLSHSPCTVSVLPSPRDRLALPPCPYPARAALAPPAWHPLGDHRENLFLRELELLESSSVYI